MSWHCQKTARNAVQSCSLCKLLNDFGTQKMKSRTRKSNAKILSESADPSGANVLIAKLAPDAYSLTVEFPAGMTKEELIQRLGTAYSDMEPIFIGDGSEDEGFILVPRPLWSEERPQLVHGTVNTATECRALAERLKSHVQSGRIKGKAAQDINRLFVVLALREEEHIRDAKASILQSKFERSRASVKAGNASAAKKPSAQAMRQIRAEWEKWQSREANYRNDAHFAMEMHRRFPVIENNGSIKNAVSKWRKLKAK